MTSSLRDLKVYTTYPHSCSYLEDQEATTLFVDPRQSVDRKLYSKLSVLGFRRSGNHVLCDQDLGRDQRSDYWQPQSLARLSPSGRIMAILKAGTKQREDI